jgi:hypothetical protein
MDRHATLRRKVRGQRPSVAGLRTTPGPLLQGFGNRATSQRLSRGCWRRPAYRPGAVSRE